MQTVRTGAGEAGDQEQGLSCAPYTISAPSSSTTPSSPAPPPFSRSPSTSRIPIHQEVFEKISSPAS
eukprot:768642-Hanusia_phi.AAC.3